MPERRRDADGRHPAVRYGLVSQSDYDVLAKALADGDVQTFVDKAVPLCEDNVPLFATLFLRYDAMPHIWREWERIQRYKRILVRLPRGHGKALALDTPIPTPSGWTTMGALRVGDVVLDENGKPCRVTFATEVQHERPCFKVTFSDGSHIIADAEHRWATQTKHERAGRKPAKVRNTLELQRTLLVANGSKQWNEYNHSIEAAKPWDLPAADLPLDPYVLGAWLGDGNSRTAYIYSDDEQVIDEVVKAGFHVRKSKEKFAWAVSDGVRAGRAGKPQSLHSILKRNGLLGNKHIPEAYLTASAEQRLALLQGLMDTDGTCSKGGQASFTTTLPHLAKQVVRLAGSLGLIPHVTERIPTIPGRPDAVCKRAYTVWFITKLPVFRLQRKLERQMQSTALSYAGGRRSIVSIESVESVPVRCIQVDSPNHLYLAGDGSIATHNTELFTKAALIHRICYSVVQGSKYADPRVLALFETRDRANDRMLIVRQLFDSGGPGGLIGAVFRGAPKFQDGRPTPWAGMAIPEIASKFGEWNSRTISLPHPDGGPKSDPNVRALSPGEATVGFHPRLVLADDIVGPKTADSQRRREVLSKWFGEAVAPMFKTYTVFWGPHTLFHEDDLNRELQKTGNYYLMEHAALDRFPTKDDYVEVVDEQGVRTGVELTPHGEELKPLWGCPLYSEAECPAFNPRHIDPNMGGIMHRPVKDLIMQWLENPFRFALQYMHLIRRTDQASVKPWMVRFFVTNPDDRRIGTVAKWHANWAEWREQFPEAGLAKDPPLVVYFGKNGYATERGGPIISPVVKCVHGWDLGFGKKKTSDRTALCRTYRTADNRYFNMFHAGRWRHDLVWDKVVTNAMTDPIRTPDEIAMEVDVEQLYHVEVAKLMREKGVQSLFKLTEVIRESDKDIEFVNSGLPLTMVNGDWFMDLDDDGAEGAVQEVFRVTPDQQGGHDDCLDAGVNSYKRIRHIRKRKPGHIGKPLPSAYRG